MLEKQPEARYPDMEAVAAALEAALAGAEGDADWDVPLLDPDAPDSRTTEELPGQVVERDTWERVEQKLKAARPRRGRTHKARREPPPPPEGPPAVVAPLEAQGPANGVEEVAEALPPPAAAVEEASAPARRVPRVRTGALVVLLGAMALAGWWALRGRTDTGPQPPGGLASHPTPHALSSGEVAAERESSEAGDGAAPLGASTPAPKRSTAMPYKTDARTKPEEKPAPRPRREAPGCVPLTTETCVVGICTLLLTGCTSTPQVVRPPPKPADCPPTAVRTMEQLGIHVGDRFLITFPRPKGGAQPVTVREDAELWSLEPFGTLPGATLYGRLHLGAELIHGRFIELRAPDGKTYPVCMALSRRGEGPIGVAREDVGGPSDSAVVISTNMVTAVDRFE